MQLPPILSPLSHVKSQSSPVIQQPQSQHPPLPTPPPAPPPLPSSENPPLGVAADPHTENGHQHGLQGVTGVPIVPPKMMMAEPFLGMNNSLALYEDFVQVGEGTYG